MYKETDSRPLLDSEYDAEDEVEIPVSGDAHNRATKRVFVERVQTVSRKTEHAIWLIHTFSLIFLTLQQTLQPLLVRRSHQIANETNQHYAGSTVVLVTEFLRLAICSLRIFVRRRSIAGFADEFGSAFTSNPLETLKVSVPAVIYVIQNNLYFFALKHLDAALFSITYQLRILTTAVLSVLILGRLFSRVQWGALLLSLLGVVLVQTASKGTGKPDGTETASNQHEHTQQLVGLTTVFAMCWTSAFAGVYLEGVFKKSDCDIWLQNIRLSVITLPMAMLTVAGRNNAKQSDAFFHGWTWLVWLIAVSSATSGIVVAVIMKYADNIKKSYCQSIALGGTAILSVMAGDTKGSFLLFTGVCLVIASVFLYALYPASKANTGASSTEERRLTTEQREAVATSSV